MALNTQQDSRLLSDLYLPYDRITSELSDAPRIVAGQNCLVTLGGKIKKRPGTSIHTSATIASGRIDRIWGYYTKENNPRFFFIASVLNQATAKWELWYKYQPRQSEGVFSWTSLGSYRDLDASTRPHVLVVSNGKCYVKSFPANISSEKLGSIVLDANAGGNPQVYPWGINGPTIPARLANAKITYTAAAIDEAATSVTVTANYGAMPATPFDVLLMYPGEDVGEEVTVTSVAGTTWTISRSFDLVEPHSKGAVVLYKNWGVSAHAVDVNLGWTYTYAYKSITGHISNRAPLETNPDLLPSNTFPFVDRKPQIEVRGTSDTTNVPKIVIYRSQDGGGIFHKLAEINNPGNTTVTFTDDDLASGALGTTFDDPIPDASLDELDRSAGLDTNSVPPTVVAPKVVGVDTPEFASNIVSYAGRLWYGIGTTLFFSAKNENATGIPEESFPAGIDGNFEKLQYNIANLLPGKNGLYIFTTDQVYKLTGTTRETFNVRPILENIGGISGEKTSVRLRDDVAFISHDYRVIRLDGNTDVPTVLSEPLDDDLSQTQFINASFEMNYWGDTLKEWLVVSKLDSDDQTNARHWIYDIQLSERSKRPFWYPPWDIRALTTYSGRSQTDDARTSLLFSTLDTDGINAALLVLDEGRSTDQKFDPPSLDPPLFTYRMEFYTNLFMVPSGNHVNTLRVPELSGVVMRAVIERSVTGMDRNPEVFFFHDSLPGQGRAYSATIDERQSNREESSFYKTMTFNTTRAALRTGLGLVSESAEPLEIYSITLAHNPDHGA